MAALGHVQPRAHRVRDRVEQVVDARAVGEVELAQRIQRQALAMVVLGFVEQLHRRPRVEFAVHLAQAPDHRRFVVVRGRDAAFRRFLDLGHVGHQHRVVRGHRAPALGDDPRLRQAIGFTMLEAYWAMP